MKHKTMTTPTQEAHNLRIATIQRRANTHGLALAMLPTPRAGSDIMRASRALDEIIEEREC